MAQSLQIKTGYKRIQILDDDGEERGVFKFNPEDIGVAKRLMDLQIEFNEKLPEWEDEAKRLDEASAGTEEKIVFVHGIVEYMKNAIDNLYGKGTSNILFGNAETLDMFTQFFDGILPFYATESKKRTAKHTAKYTK